MTYHCVMPGCNQPVERSFLCRQHRKNDLRVPEYVVKIGVERIYEFIYKKNTDITSLDIIKQFDPDVIVSMDILDRDKKIDAIGKFFRTLRENGYLVKTGRKQNSVVYDIVSRTFKNPSLVTVIEEPCTHKPLPGDTIITFGKYIGYSIQEVAYDDPEYLVSVLSNPSIAKDFKGTLEEFLREHHVKTPVKKDSKQAISEREGKKDLELLLLEQQTVLASALADIQGIKSELVLIKEALKEVNKMHACPMLRAHNKITESLQKLEKQGQFVLAKE